MLDLVQVALELTSATVESSRADTWTCVHTDNWCLVRVRTFQVKFLVVSIQQGTRILHCRQSVNTT